MFSSSRLRCLKRSNIDLGCPTTTELMKQCYNCRGIMQTETKTLRILELEHRDNNDDLKSTTPAQRLAMMWQLTLDAWAFKGEPVAELRLPRHLVRVLRRKS